MPTAVLEEHTDVQPTAFTLSQNYLNPFNPETTIRFDLPQPQDIELAIYNLERREWRRWRRGIVRLDRTQCDGMV